MKTLTIFLQQIQRDLGTILIMKLIKVIFSFIRTHVVICNVKTLTGRRKCF